MCQTKIQLFEILRSLEAVPGVPIETGAEVKTPATLRMPEEDDEMTEADDRPTGEGRRQHDAEQVGETLRVPPKPEIKANAWPLGT
ncbi:unnamed protein product [Ectocarpus sp. CCAP 1310/34]|nr:unnamed protein product [Ectocarpus sp. CCAP 1310/34]